MENEVLTFDKNLDAEFLFELYGNDKEHAKMVFEEFLNSAPGMMDEIEESFRKNVVEDFRKHVHKMKPVFSFVGLTHLTKHAETLEHKCRNSGRMEDLSDLYNDLKIQYQKYLPIVRDEVIRLENQK